MDLKAETNIFHRVIASERGRTREAYQNESITLKHTEDEQPINHLMNDEAEAVITVQSKEHQSFNSAWFTFAASGYLIN